MSDNTWRSCKKEPPTTAKGELCIVEVRDPKWETGQSATLLYEDKKYLCYGNGSKFNYTKHVREWKSEWRYITDQKELDFWSKYFLRNKIKYQELQEVFDE